MEMRQRVGTGTWSSPVVVYRVEVLGQNMWRPTSPRGSGTKHVGAGLTPPSDPEQSRGSSSKQGRSSGETFWNTIQSSRRTTNHTPHHHI